MQMNNLDNHNFEDLDEDESDQKDDGWDSEEENAMF